MNERNGSQSEFEHGNSQSWLNANIDDQQLNTRRTNDLQ